MKSHIDDFDLFEFSRGEKSILARLRIRAHLLTCADCRSRVESFQMSNRLVKLALVGEFPSRRHVGWFSGWRITLFALTVAFLGGIMGLKTLSANDLPESEAVPRVGFRGHAIHPRHRTSLSRCTPKAQVAPLKAVVAGGHCHPSQ